MNIDPQKYTFDQKVNWLLTEVSQIEKSYPPSLNTIIRVEDLFKKIIEVCIDYHKAQTYDSSTLQKVFRKAEDVVSTLKLQENETIQQFHRIVKQKVDILSLPEAVQNVTTLFLNSQEVLNVREINPAYQNIGDQFFLDKINNGEPLKDLGLSLEDLKKFLIKHASQIYCLNFSEAPWSSSEITPILQNENLRNVKDLNFSDTKLDSPAASQISTFTQLKSLNLAGSKISSENLSLIVKMTPDLEVLDASFCGLNDDAAQAFESLKLKKLIVWDCSLSKSSIASIGKIETLEHLNISDNNLASDGAESLQNLRLKTLIASACNLSGPSMAFLSQIGSLEQLDLNSNPIGLEGFRALQTLIKLRNLDAATCEIDDSAMSCIGNLPSLEELNICGNSVGNEGINHLKKLKNLKKLEMGFNNSSFAPSIGGLLNLEYLDMGWFLLEDPNLASLETLVKLKELKLSFSGTIDALVKLLQKLTCLENLKIHWYGIKEEDREALERLNIKSLTISE